MNEKVRVGGPLDLMANIALVLGLLLTTAAFIMTFTIVPVPESTATVNGFAMIGDKVVTAKLMFSQKIFYFHMPVAVVSLGILAFTAIFGVMFLVKRDHRWDLNAKVVTEISLVFILMTMASGEFWTAFEWNAWWVWEPRLTTYLILTLLVIGYFILRNAVDDPEKRAVFASVFGILAFIDAVISLLITRIIPTAGHPVLEREGGLEGMMVVALVACIFGMIFLAFGLCRFRIRQQRLQLRLETLKEKLED
jgi:heme exporter protein C